MGYRNVMWGSDYPHMEGTFGHTQDTLHGLFDHVGTEIRHRVTIGAFLDNSFPRSASPCHRPSCCVVLGYFLYAVL